MIQCSNSLKDVFLNIKKKKKKSLEISLLQIDTSDVPDSEGLFCQMHSVITGAKLCNERGDEEQSGIKHRLPFMPLERTGRANAIMENHILSQ